MSGEDILRKWRHRCAFPLGYAHPLKALKEILCDFGVENPDWEIDYGDEYAPVKLSGEGVTHELQEFWTDHLGQKVAICERTRSEPEIVRLDALLYALWDDSMPAAALYEAHWQSFSYYAVHPKGKGGLKFVPVWPNRPGQTETPAAEQEQNAILNEPNAFLEKVAAAPWHAWGPRFRRLLDNKPSLAISDAEQYFFERVATSLRRYVPLPESYDGEFAIPIRPGGILSGVLTAARPDGVAEEQKLVIEAAAAHIETQWTLKRTAEVYADALAAAKSASPSGEGDLESAWAFRAGLCKGLPILELEAAIGEDRCQWRLNPSAHLPSLQQEAAAAVFNPALDMKFGKQSVSVKYSMACEIDAAAYWEPWRVAIAEAVALRAPKLPGDSRRLEEWFKDEALLSVPDPSSGLQLGKFDLDPKSLAAANSAEFRSLIEWRDAMKRRVDHLDARGPRGGRESLTIDELFTAAAAVACIHCGKKSGKLQWINGRVIDLSNHDSLDQLLQHRFSSSGPSETTTLTRPVRFAIECAFYLATRHSKNGTIGVAYSVQVDSKHLSEVVLTVACDDYSAFDRDVQAAPIETCLRRETGPGAWVATTRTNPATAELRMLMGGVSLSLLNRMNHDMRPESGMLFHHPTEARKRWPEEKGYYKFSQAKWNPIKKPPTLEPTDLSAVIENLLQTGSDFNQKAFDLGGIWSYFRLMGCDSRVTLPPTEPGGLEAFFVYLPEWYEILIASSDSLLAESLTKNSDVEVLLDLETGDERAWETPGLGLSSEHTLTLWWADNGNGILPADFERSLDPTRRVGKFRQAIQRAMTVWSAQVIIYNKLKGGEIYQLHLDRNIEAQPVSRSNEPTAIWDHFTKESGLCVKFELKIAPMVGAAPKLTVNWALGAAVVDLAGHQFDFGKRNLPVFSSWAAFDKESENADWDELWVHLGDYRSDKHQDPSDRRPSLADLEQLVSGEGESEFAKRGRTAKRIVIFTGGTQSINIAPRTEAGWWRRARATQRLEEPLDREVVNRYLEKHFSLAELDVRLRNARSKNREDDIALYEKRKKAIEDFEKQNENRRAVGNA